MHELQSTIENAFANRAKGLSEDSKEAISRIIAELDAGTLRVAEFQGGQWQVNPWVKQCILLYFQMRSNTVISTQAAQYYDKVPLKFQDYSEEQFAKLGVRVVPPATARYGTFMEPNVVLMPSYVNIGAYIGEGTMVDTWATVGSCAQIGKHVHLSGGVGIGGVLEPLQAAPTIIEDNCFIGARSEIVEGVIVEHDSVISMGVYIGQSTPIYNRHTKEIVYGKVPAGSVVVPGSLPSKDGSHSLYAAIIVKQVDDKTRGKTALNDILRNVGSE